jgi:transposase-like protein
MTATLNDVTKKKDAEPALSEEMTEHRGFEKHDPAGAGTGNIRNGTRAKTVLTESTGHVEIDVPRDRDGSFEPQIVRKRQRRLNGVDEIVLSLYAKGGLAAVCEGEVGAQVSARGPRRGVGASRVLRARPRSAGGVTAPWVVRDVPQAERRPAHAVR